MGTIISPKISEAVNIFSPVSKFNQFLISGAIADIPKAQTTEGIPAKKFNYGLNYFFLTDFLLFQR